MSFTLPIIPRNYHSAFYLANPVNSYNDLPGEILGEVGSCLDIQSIGRFSCVSKNTRAETNRESANAWSVWKKTLESHKFCSKYKWNDRTQQMSDREYVTKALNSQMICNTIFSSLRIGRMRDIYIHKEGNFIITNFKKDCECEYITNIIEGLARLFKGKCDSCKSLRGQVKLISMKSQKERILLQIDQKTNSEENIIKLVQDTRQPHLFGLAIGGSEHNFIASCLGVERLERDMNLCYIEDCIQSGVDFIRNNGRHIVVATVAIAMQCLINKFAR